MRSLLLLAAFVPSVAAAMPISEVRVSNANDAWYAPQGSFDPGQPVLVYVTLSSANHQPFYYSGQCVFSLEATGAELGRVMLPSVLVNNGVDRVVSPMVQLNWPRSAVLVTCVPDSDPAGALTTRLDSGLLAWGGGSRTPPQAQATNTTVVVMQAPPISYQPEPVQVDGTAVCKQRLLDHGWSPSGLPNCKGVEPTCATTLLDKGWSPDGLPNCVGVDATCAESLLNRGWSPDGLPNCVGVDATCATALLDQGYSPDGLSGCR